MAWRRFTALAVLTATAAAIAWVAPRGAGVEVACAGGSFDRSCKLVFVEQTTAAFRNLAHLVFRVTYPREKLDFGDPAACAAHPLQQGVTATFTNDPFAGILEATLDRANGLFPYPLVVCTPQGAADAQGAPLQVTVLESRDIGGQPLDKPAVVGLETFECTTTTLATTTTVIGDTTSTVPNSTSTTTTTTTLVDDGLCGDADDNGSITASDALLALRTAIGGAHCPLARCDTNGDGFINTTDSLRILRKAVGIGGALDC
jgi:hypothetical protein